MNKFKYLLLAIIVAATVSLPVSKASTQSFLNFSIDDSIQAAENSCKKTKGQWAEVVSRIGFVTKAYACAYKSQVVREDKQSSSYSYTPVKPSIVYFGTLENRIVFVDYIFKFKTWDMRNHFKMSLTEQLNKLFPLSVKRLSPNEHKLNNTQYYLQMKNTDFAPDNKYVLHIFLSDTKDGMNNYISEGVELQ